MSRASVQTLVGELKRGETCKKKEKIEAFLPFSSRWCYSTRFGFLFRRCLWLHWPLPPWLLRLLQTLVIAPCASGVTDALFLPVLLVSPPGAWRRWALRLLSGSAPLADSAPEGRARVAGSWVAPGSSALSRVVRLVPVHPPLCVQMCGILWTPGLVDRGAFIVL